MINVILPIRTPVIAVPPQAPPHESSQNAAPSTDSTANASGARDFAGALDQASAKHSRKDDSNKPAAGKRGGDALPPSGSVTPPASTAPALPAQILGANGTPVSSPSLDDGEDAAPDAASPTGSVAATAGTAGATTSNTAPSGPGAGSDLATASTTAGSAQDATGAQGTVFATTPDLSQTAAETATATAGAPPTSAASATTQAGTTQAGTTQAGDASAAVATALAAKSSTASATGGAGAIANSVSASKLPSPASVGAPAAGGRTAAQTASASTSSSAESSGDTSAAAQTPAASGTLVNLALAEGSDATGSAAAALQAASAAASAPAPVADATTAAASPFTSLQISMTPPVGGASSATTLNTAGLTSSAVSSLDSGSDTRGHNGAGDPGSDAGSGSFAGGDGAAALQQLSTNAVSSSSDASPVPTVTVHADVDSADFPQGVADKVSLAVDNGWSSAKLSVNPPQLGPIELQIAVQGGHAQVAMSTHSAVTREALESSVPNLRHMLNSQGFTQVSVDISQRSFQERSAPEQPYGRAAGAARETAPVASSSAQVSRAPLGMLDTYA